MIRKQVCVFIYFIMLDIETKITEEKNRNQIFEFQDYAAINF